MYRVSIASSRKSVITLYCSPACAYGHGVRFVLSEKAIAAGVQEAWIGGVGTRKVDDLAQALGISGISQSTPPPKNQ